MEQEAQEELTLANHDVNRYPVISEALRRIQQHELFEDVEVFKLDVRTLANGEITCRWLAVGEEDWEGFTVLPG